MSFVEFLKAYGLTGLSILATIFSLIIAWLKARKNGNTKGMLAILEKIPSLVVTAESLYGSGKGSAKLDYVLTQLRLFALQNNIKVDVDDLTAQINSVVETTKNVNTTIVKADDIPSNVNVGNAGENINVTAQDTLNI